MSVGRSSYDGLFDDWEVALARNAVTKFKVKYPWLHFPEFEDLLQECLTQWYFARERFQPVRGASVRTYMTRVVTLRLQAILREQSAHKRRLNHLACSLDEPLGESGKTLADVVAADETHPDPDLRSDLQTVLKELTPLQQSICRLLVQGYSVKGVAEAIDKPRTTVRDHVSRIRETFIKKGLTDHLTWH